MVGQTYGNRRVLLHREVRLSANRKRPFDDLQPFAGHHGGRIALGARQDLSSRIHQKKQQTCECVT